MQIVHSHTEKVIYFLFMLYIRARQKTHVPDEIKLIGLGIIHREFNGKILPLY